MRKVKKPTRFFIRHKFLLMALVGIVSLIFVYRYNSVKSDNISITQIQRIEQKIDKVDSYSFISQDALNDIRNDYIKALKAAKEGNSKSDFYEKIADIEIYFYLSGYIDGFGKKPVPL